VCSPRHPFLGCAFNVALVRACLIFRDFSCATECLTRVVHDGWFAGVVVSLAHTIPCFICVGAHFGHTSDRAMADGTAVMP
jgi:hypothetical protein